MKWKNKRSQLARNLQLFSNIIMLKFNPLSLLLHLLLPVLENMSQCYRRDVRKCTFCTTFIDSHIAHHISPLTDNVERMKQYCEHFIEETRLRNELSLKSYCMRFISTICVGFIELLARRKSSVVLSILMMMMMVHDTQQQHIHNSERAHSTLSRN